MALYSLEVFKELLLASSWCYLNEKRAFDTLDKLGWDHDNLLQVLSQLHKEDFQKTVPNCKINDYIGVDYVPADQYEIHWDEEGNFRRPISTRTTTSLSLKIAIMTNTEGQAAGLVTIHLSGSAW
jgi:hypothetical protein